MLRNTFFLFLSIAVSLSISAKPIQKGPYTVKTLTDGVYNIEDSNDSNPAGMVTGDDGQIVHMNNCSDMYLIVGTEKALLLDLSNEVNWDKTAKESLRSIIYERIKDKDLFITVTHKHGDHLGMLPAFADDSRAKFWIPANEFKGINTFSEKQTTRFSENASLDLGGMEINTLEVPGHTTHSTVFFLKNKKMVFTGDAIGSGSGVWLFDKDSFYTYIKSIDKLISHIEKPANNIDTENLAIYGGHGWQRGNHDKLTSQYIYDMKELIERMGLGIAEEEKMAAMFPFLDTNFKYGTAAISWNKESASEYTASKRKEFGSFSLISKRKDYGLSLTRLVVDLGEGTSVTGKDLLKENFSVTGLNKSGKTIRDIKKIIVTNRRGYAIDSGRYVTLELDYVYDADPSNAYFFLVQLKKDIGKYTAGSRFIQHGRTIRK